MQSYKLPTVYQINFLHINFNNLQSKKQHIAIFSYVQLTKFIEKLQQDYSGFVLQSIERLGSLDYLEEIN